MSRRRCAAAPKSKIRGRTALIGFSGVRADTRIADLSGGEKARLLMGLATFDGPQLIILDEPTNHLDIDSRGELIEAINEYEGACILVSHDRRLLEACVDRLWLVADGTVRTFDGDVADYSPLRARQGRAEGERAGRQPPAEASAGAGAHAPRSRAAAQGDRRHRAEDAPLPGPAPPHRRGARELERDGGQFRQGRRSRAEARRARARADRGRGGVARAVVAGGGGGGGVVQLPLLKPPFFCSADKTSAEMPRCSCRRRIIAMASPTLPVQNFSDAGARANNLLQVASR